MINNTVVDINDMVATFLSLAEEGYKYCVIATSYNGETGRTILAINPISRDQELYEANNNINLN